MNGTVVFVLLIVLVAFVFDFINGFHDSANSIATVVSTRVLSPRLAVLWAAFFNFVAAFGLGMAVAKTMGKGLIHVEVVDPSVIVAGLLGAIAWDLITWWYAIPSSSSHALMGGYAGAAIAKAGIGALIPGGWLMPILFIFLAPLAAYTSWPFRRICRRFGAALVTTEVVKASALLLDIPATLQVLEFKPDEHPISGQILALDPDEAGEAAARLGEMAADEAVGAA